MTADTVTATVEATSGGPAAPLAQTIPIYRLDIGRLLKNAKWWWLDLLAAQRFEIDRTLGQSSEQTSFVELDRLPSPSVLVVPVAAGGAVAKSQWLDFQDALWRFGELPSEPMTNRPRRSGGVWPFIGEAGSLIVVWPSQTYQPDA